MASNKKAPKWFDEKNYKYLRELNAAGWVHELSKCCHWASETQKMAAGQPTLEDGWEGVPELQGWFPAYYDLPAIYVIKDSTLPPCKEDTRECPTRLHHKVPPMTLDHFTGPALTIRINLRASDQVLVREFKKKLQDARDRCPSPVKKPGKKALNSSIRQNEINGWINHKIVEITELYFREAKEGHKVTKADLGRWLFSTYSLPDKTVCDALKTRDRAFATIDALWHEPIGEESGKTLPGTPP